MSHPPLNLAARDFDAYAPEKATSNAYSRPRLELKQRALGWARGVVARLAELGIAVEVYGSDEHPSRNNKKRVDCQWVFFSRDQAARDELDRLIDRGRSIAAEIDDPSPFTRHAFLALRLDAASVEVCFAVHPEARLDADNLRARLSLGDGPAAELVAALRALPEQFTLGASTGDRKAASTSTAEALRALVDRIFGRDGGDLHDDPLWIGWSVTRDTAVEHSGLLDEQLEDAIVALAPVYRLVAWSRDNDHIALDRRIESAEQDRARAHAEAQAQTERWRTEQAEAHRTAAEQARARKPSLDALFASKPSPPRGAPPPPRSPETARPAVPTRAPSKPPPPAVAPTPVSQEQPSVEIVAHPAEPAGERAPARAAPPVVEKGAKVRVLSGPFAEKIGVIGELDGRGGARVLLGLLSTRLEVADLEPVAEGRERPALQSSHRRPAAPAPRKAR